MKLQSLLEALNEKAPKDAIYGIFADGKDMTARYSDKFEAETHMRELAKKNPKVSYEVKKADPEKIEEGEERQIIMANAVDIVANLVQRDLDQNEIKDMESLEQTIYDELSRLDVGEVIDPDYEVGGQRIGDFANGKVLDVIDSGRAIDGVKAELNISPELAESFKHYQVKHKRTGKVYKVTAMHDNSAKEKARAQHGGTASRYTGTSTDDFEILESDGEEDYSDMFDMLDQIRDSGKINMFGAARYLVDMYGIDKYKAREVLAAWMKSYKKPYKVSSLAKPFVKNPSVESITMEDEEVACDECGGDGIDLDTLYFGSDYDKPGTETDCHVCGGTGYVPKEDMEEGKSPHKKGSAKYKKHMAAKHASMGEAMGKKMISIQTSVGLMPAYSDHSPLSAKDYHDWTMRTDKSQPKANIVSQRYGIYLDDFKRYAMESIQVGDELMIETADGEGIVVPVLHVVDENVLVGWDELAEDIFTEQDRQIAELKKLAGIEENLVPFEKPDEVNKAVEVITKEGLPMSAKFVNWCKDNDCQFSMNFMDNPKELKKAAIAKIRFEKETGYGTGGEILRMKPPVQQELPFKPRDPQQQELDFDEDLDEAEYQGRKVKLNKPTRGDVKKFKVYVKDPKTGNIKKVNFGHGGSSAKKAGQKTMKIKKSNPKRRKSFRARHNCDNPGPKTKARYWSCRAW